MIIFLAITNRYNVMLGKPSRHPKGPFKREAKVKVVVHHGTTHNRHGTCTYDCVVRSRVCLLLTVRRLKKEKKTCGKLLQVSRERKKFQETNDKSIRQTD